MIDQRLHVGAAVIDHAIEQQEGVESAVRWIHAAAFGQGGLFKQIAMAFAVQPRIETDEAEAALCQSIAEIQPASLLPPKP
jgi:hypothetical protein